MTDEKPRMHETSKARCPICGKPRDPAYRPFCSQRCADIDLGRWLSESYTMPMPADEAFGDPDDTER
jgi:uncharacterized protein